MNSNAVLKTESLKIRTTSQQERFHLSISIFAMLGRLEELSSRKEFLLRDVEKGIRSSQTRAK